MFNRFSYTYTLYIHLYMYMFMLCIYFMTLSPQINPSINSVQIWTTCSSIKKKYFMFAFFFLFRHTLFFIFHFYIVSLMTLNIYNAVWVMFSRQFPAFQCIIYQTKKSLYFIIKEKKKTFHCIEERNRKMWWNVTDFFFFFLSYIYCIEDLDCFRDRTNIDRYFFLFFFFHNLRF